MELTALPPELARIRARHGRIHTIVSPPRCCSTAFARALWEHPTVRYYSHEPFEVTYYRDLGLQEVVAQLEAPLDLAEIKRLAANSRARSLVIKEMPYQVGRRFPLLAELSTPPLVFLIRDPRLNIASRIRKKLEVGDDPIFPLLESGWELIETQIEFCERHDIGYMIVDSADFRRSPRRVIGQVLDQLGLEARSEVVRWHACSDVELDNLGGEHSHLYRKVLASRGVTPEERPKPALDWFPERGGMRDHVRRCLEIYQRLREAAKRIEVPTIAATE